MARKQVHEIEVQATPQQVWRAVTEADHIIRWFAPQARVEPGLGGKVWISWGPGMEGEAPIHLWEPDRRFGWTEGEGDRAKLVELTIEAKDGFTLVRLTQGGFGDGPRHADEYESVDGGWQTFLASLQHALAVHQGQSFQPVCRMLVVPGSRDTVVSLLNEQLRFDPPLNDIPVGGSYTATLPNGIAIEGTRLNPFKPGYYLLTVADWNESLIAFFSEQAGDKTYVTFQGYLFGPGTERAQELESAFAAINTASSPSA
jgi:uncharacterized protein YndB with AHSA1/START domain